MVSSVFLFVSVSLASIFFFPTLWLCYLPVFFFTIHYFLQLISSYYFFSSSYLLFWYAGCLLYFLSESFLFLNRLTSTFSSSFHPSPSCSLTRHPPGHSASSLGSLCFSSTFTLSFSLDFNPFFHFPVFLTMLTSFVSFSYYYFF